MENASKALLMAASILVGVMLLTLGVYLFSIFGDYGTQISKRIEQQQIDEFNSQFYKFENSQEVRIHDIISITNLAMQYNQENDFESTSKYHIKVTINGIGVEGKDLETITEESKKTALINKYALKSDNKTIQYFRCVNVTVEPISKIVNSITFEIIE